MFRALAAWHSAVLSLLPAAVWAEDEVGAVPPLAIVRYWLAIDSYRPSKSAVFGGIPLAARIRVRVTLVTPCCSAEDSAIAHRSASTDRITSLHQVSSSVSRSG